MKHRVNWPEQRHGEPRSAFEGAPRSRALRITFHTQTLHTQDAEEGSAIEFLRELANLPEIDAIDTAPGIHPYIVLEGAGPDSDQYLFRVEHCDRSLQYIIPQYQQWIHIADRRPTTKEDPRDTIVHRVEEILIARAHHALRRDVLITLSPYLLANQSECFLRDISPISPSEALKVVGLYLRFRGDYTIQASRGGGRACYDRDLFYWVLARHRLPHMWRYFSACVQAGKVRNDDITGLGESVLTRCVRALQARDEIGYQFYAHQDNATRDTILYHFDYMTLLLSGAFDALGRVAWRTYGITQPPEYRVAFDREDFPKALRAHGATDLYNAVTSRDCCALFTLLNGIRNTIHGAGLSALAVKSVGSPQESFIRVPNGLEAGFLNAIEILSPITQWGITKEDSTYVEPYSFAVALVDTCFKWIDVIADATDVIRLFPKGEIRPALQDGPPPDQTFAESIRKRIDALG